MPSIFLQRMPAGVILSFGVAKERLPHWFRQVCGELYFLFIRRRLLISPAASSIFSLTTALRIRSLPFC